MRDRISVAFTVVVVWLSATCTYYATAAFNNLNRGMGRRLPVVTHWGVAYSKYFIVFVFAAILSAACIAPEIRGTSPLKKRSIQLAVVIIMIVLSSLAFLAVSLPY